MMRRAQTRLATATCPVCGGRDKPLKAGRFTRHSDSVTGECRAAGHTVQEARNLAEEVRHTDESVHVVLPPVIVTSLRKEDVVLQEGTMTQILSEDGSGVATQTVGTTADPALAGMQMAPLETKPAKRVHKPRSDQAQYLVVAAVTELMLFATENEAKAEAIARIQSDEADGAYVVYQVRALRQFQRSIQETALSRVRKG